MKRHSLSSASPQDAYHGPNICADLALLTRSIPHAFVHDEICSKPLVPNEKTPSLAPQRGFFQTEPGTWEQQTCHRQPQGGAGACLTSANSGMFSSSASYARRARQDSSMPSRALLGFSRPPWSRRINSRSVSCHW